MLICERSGQKGAWQFPQGGIDPGETALEAVRREIGEEVGFLPSQYDIVESGFWYSRRRSQSLSWVQSLVHEALLTAFEQHPAVASRMPILENMVAGDKMDPVSAAHDLLSHFTYPAPGH